MNDTGSGVTAARCSEAFPGHQIRESKDGKRRIKYVSANNGVMENQGETEVQFMATEPLHIVFQNADVNYPIIPGRRLMRKGCEIYLAKTHGWILLPDGNKVDIVVDKGVLWAELKALEPREQGLIGPGL